MYLIRPNQILTTPREIADLLGLRLRKASASVTGRFNWERDTFLAYPKPTHVRASNAIYETLHRFYISSKADQRLVLQDLGVQVPAIATQTDNELISRSGKFVVRPKRHYGGRHYRITDQKDDFDEKRQYISEAIEKKREYRYIYYKGNLVSRLRKKVPKGTDPLAPWNHACGASFVSIDPSREDNLGHTVNEDLLEVPIIKHAHLVAVDILQDFSNVWYVAELNFCPGLTIPQTFEEIRRIENAFTH